MILQRDYSSLIAKLDLAPHQKKAVDELGNGKILTGGVGSGKSRAAVAYYLEQEAPRDVYVFTTAKKRDSLDWEAEFVRGGVSTHPDESMAGILHVDSYNNMLNYIDIEDAFVIMDEQRLVGSGLWVKCFQKIAKKNRWIMLSATPGDTWMDYIPVFVANGFYKNMSEFKREHVVYASWSKFPKVERYMGVNKLMKQKHAVLVEMPYARHTTRVLQDVLVPYDVDLFERSVKNRWNPFLDEPQKDVAELFRVMRRIVNSDQSRVEAVKTLTTVHPRLIVFYNFNYELDMLKSGLAGLTSCGSGVSDPSTTQTTSSELSQTSDTDCPWTNSTGCSCMASTTEPRSSDDHPLTDSSRGSNHNSKVSTSEAKQRSSSTCSESSISTTTDFEIAEWNGKRHQPIPDSEHWVYLVQYTAGAEGWNCIDTDAMVFFSLTYSYRLFEQAQGRIDRLNTPYSVLTYYILRSDSLIDRAIWKALKVKRNFNEKKMLAA